MPRIAPAVPAESDLLCETCGYTLAGLPADSNCPECGTLVSKSLPETRQPSRWERHRTVANFWRDTAAVLLSPSRFFRSLGTRDGFDSADGFLARHLVLTSILFTLAAAVHANLVFYYGSTRVAGRGPGVVITPLIIFGALIGLAVATLCVLTIVTHIAAKLTTLEGTYRGYRLPYRPVLRVLCFHAAGYLPVALLGLATTAGYSLATARDWLSPDTLVTYLYVLSAEVVLAAGYLFNTYWRAMRATMWANG